MAEVPNSIKWDENYYPVVSPAKLMIYGQFVFQTVDPVSIHEILFQW